MIPTNERVERAAQGSVEEFVAREARTRTRNEELALLIEPRMPIDALAGRRAV
jgi:hypothetical protein